jgi:exodeoxyribonuclease VII large subunit
MVASFSDSEYDSDGLVAKEAPGDNAPAMSITAISALLKRVVEDRFGFVRLRGEISGVKRAASGHLYLALKDEGAKIDGVMWKGNAARLGFRPEDGIEVIATGKLTTYPGRSNYQIVIDRMEIAGEGALLALLAKTKARLEAEGLFDPRRKRALPFLPRVIGVVTSPTGAVIRDILHRLRDRFPVQVLVWPVLVQGQGAAAQVAAAVRGFSDMPDDKRPDLVIVARGGGSIEDLWAFNEEAVVRAIAQCAIPIISAVGHETDTTLADFAADLRAPTPTAAAEMAVPVREELLAQIAELAIRGRRAAVRPIGMGRERLEARIQRLPRPETLLNMAVQRLDEGALRLRRGLGGRVVIAGGHLQKVAGRLSLPLLTARLHRAQDRLAAVRLSPNLLITRREQQRAKLDSAARMMQSLNPDNVLKRGYVRVTGANGQTLVARELAAAETALTLHFRDGDLAVAPHSQSAVAPHGNGAVAQVKRPAAPRAVPSEIPPSQGKLL